MDIRLTLTVDGQTLDVTNSVTSFMVVDVVGHIHQQLPRETWEALGALLRKNNADIQRLMALARRAKLP